MKVLRPALWGSSRLLVPSQQQGRDPRWTGGTLAHLVAFQSSGSESTFSRSSQEVCRTSFPSLPLKHWPTKTAVESKAGVAVSNPSDLGVSQASVGLILMEPMWVFAGKCCEAEVLSKQPLMLPHLELVLGGVLLSETPSRVGKDQGRRDGTAERKEGSGWALGPA